MNRVDKKNKKIKKVYFSKLIGPTEDIRTRRKNINILSSILIKGASIAISLILVPLTLGYLTPFEYGVWITLSSVLTWVNYFDVGLGNGLRNKLATTIANQDFELGRIYVSTTFFLMSLIVLIILIFFFMINLFVDWNYLFNVSVDSVPNLSNIVISVFVFFCLSFIFKTVGTIYIACQYPVVNDLLIFLGNLLSCFLIWLLVKTADGSGSLFKVATVFSVSPVVIYILAYPITFYYKYKQFRPSLKSIKMCYAKDLGSLGVQFFFLQIACLIIFSTANFLISNLFDPSAVTPYNIVFRYFNVISMTFAIIISPLWTAITDAYVKKEILWIERTIVKMIRIWWLSILGLILMVLCSKSVFKIWLGDEIQIPYALSIAMAVYSAVFIWTQIFAAFSNGIGQLKVQLIGMILAAILFIPLAVFLSSFLGVEGVIYAMAIVLLIPAITLYLDYKSCVFKFKKAVVVRNG